MDKKCSKCQIVKSTDYFYKSSQTIDGFKYYCKKCELQYQQENRSITRKSTNKWASKNKQKIKLKNKRLQEKYKKDNENVVHSCKQLQCSNCLKTKNIKSFSKNSTNKNGYNFWCKLCLKKANQDYTKRHPNKNRNNTANYNARKLKRTPIWADLIKIAEIYKNCPKGYHVDHIVPLNGKTVSGLHVHYNLQYLTASENTRKKNRF